MKKILLSCSLLLIITTQINAQLTVSGEFEDENTLKLCYAFGSEEYMEFAGAGFNDIFAFWVSGPDILLPKTFVKQTEKE